MTTIHAMIQRHADLHRELDRLYKAGGDVAADGQEYRAIAREAMELEHRIIAMPATCEAEAAAKRALIAELDDIDLGRLIESILALDAEHIAVAA